MNEDYDQGRSAAQLRPDAGIDRGARRRLLLKAVGKGAAVAAATVPIRTLASTSSLTKNGYICSISGMQSAVHSASPNLPTCGTYTPGYYNAQQLGHWPNYNSTTGLATNTVTDGPYGSVTFTQNSTFESVFMGGSMNKLIDIMPPGPPPYGSTTDEMHWIGALLSAISPPPGFVNPYSPGEVLKLYQANNAAGIAFFKWLEQNSSI
jgi:hypothetical protein